MLWRDKLSFKLARTGVLIAFTVGIILSAAQVYSDYLLEGDALDGHVDKSLEVSKKTATRAVLILDNVLAQEVIAGLLEYDYVVSAEITDDHGKALATDSRDRTAEDDGLEFLDYFVERYKTYSTGLDMADSVADQPGQLVVVVDRVVGLKAFFSRAVTIFMTGIVRNFILVLLLYWAFSRLIATPLSRLAADVSAIDADHPGSSRLSVPEEHKKDEIGMLVRGINKSLDSVQMLMDNLRSTNRALAASEEALRRRSWQLEQEAEKSRETARELLMTKEEAEAANQAKSLFLANVSHELRTPLNAVIGFSSIMADEMFGPIENKKYREYLSDIRDSSQHLSALLGEVLDLAKIEAGRMAIEEKTVRMGQLLDESITLVRGQATAKNLVVEANIQDNLPNIYGDRLRIKQTVLNLLSNAIKFTPDGNGSVELNAKLNDDGDMQICVADKGIGIAESDKDIIFAPFLRSSNAHSRSHEGTGLGLSIAKAFMEMHGGDIEVQSAVGEGTTFTITLPAERLRERVQDVAETA